MQIPPPILQDEASNNYVTQWISPHAAQITEVAVLNGTSNDTQCGTQDLHLAFSLPVRIPVNSLQLKVNFTEVLDPGSGPRSPRFIVRTYPAQTNATQVRFPIPENVAQAVEGYPRFRLQAKLVVNRTEGQIWSEFSPTIQTHCKLYSMYVSKTQQHCQHTTCITIARSAVHNHQRNLIVLITFIKRPKSHRQKIPLT